MTKLLVLDRDGTITQNRVRPGDYINKASELEPIPGAKEAIARYAANGWKVAIASNQGGVEKGFISLEECLNGFQRTMNLFPEIECCVFCPCAWPSTGDTLHLVFPGDKQRDRRKFSQADSRKPGAGMLLFLKLLLDADELLYVGDRAEDQEAASNAGTPFLWAHEWRCDS